MGILDGCFRAFLDILGHHFQEVRPSIFLWHKTCQICRHSDVDRERSLVTIGKDKRRDKCP